MTLSQGGFSGDRGSGTIYRDTRGTAITYDVAGQRKSATYTASIASQRWAYMGPNGQLAVPTGDPNDGGHWELR